MATSSDFEYMRLEREGKLAWLTFTRQRYLNAMNMAAAEELHRAATSIADDAEARILIVRGEGRAFSTGIDLKELAAGGTSMRYFRRWDEALRVFETMEKIVIAGVHGYCLGGALQLALACDIRVSTPDCQLGLPAIKESLIPGLGTWRLPEYIGWGRAKRMILGGENIRGEEARAIGLVDHVAPAEGFFSHVDAIAGRYVRACSTGTRMSKLLTSRAFELDYDAFFQHYLELQERAFTSADASEAKRAYLAKEDPVWK